MTFNRRILVTGASGLIGGCAAKALHEKKYEVVGLYRQLGLGEASLPWQVIQCDLLREDATQKLNEVDFDLVVHCAAVLPSQLSGGEAQQAALANRTMDDRILDLCLRRGCPVVYTSTVSVYGLRIDTIATEEDDPKPIGEYASAKAASEAKMLRALAAGAIILRVSSPYGPGQRRRNVLRIFIERALAGLDLVYHGDGNRRQDFVSAYDVGNAVVCCASRIKSNGIFNIASGNSISMRDLAELVVRTVPGTGSRIIPSGAPDSQEDYRAAFSISKAQTVLGWRPSISLTDGIRSWAQYLKDKN